MRTPLIVLNLVLAVATATMLVPGAAAADDCDEYKTYCCPDYASNCCDGDFLTQLNCQNYHCRGYDEYQHCTSEDPGRICLVSYRGACQVWDPTT